MNMFTSTQIILAVMVVVYIAAKVFKVSTELSLLFAALAGGLAGGAGIPARHIVEGAFTYLDIWHIERELKYALGEENKETVTRLKLLALQGKLEEILDQLIAAAQADVEKVDKITKAAQYLINNAEWVRNIPLVDGYGSGPVEKTVDITVSRRFKKRGMSWYRHGVNPLLQLRLLKLNDEWNTYWNQRKNDLARYAA